MMSEHAARAARQTLPRAARLRKRREFDRVVRGGVCLADRRMRLWAIRNDLGWSRLGLIVGRQHGNAVARNRIKRLLREAFRLRRAELPVGLDLVCRPHAQAELDLQGAGDSLVRLAERSRQRLDRACGNRNHVRPRS